MTTFAHTRGTLMRLTCERCRERFTYRVWKGAWPKYCSAACRQATYRERAKIRRATKAAERYRREHRPRIKL
jgi:hypothetical protein